ncbi:MAG: Methionyl-tRNA formyltransferase [Thermoanaerobacterales bacterium 50_218]|nr:MAG: Methionyl-tRNA formyltransferase [Thermoanaerobacterales bacterium 50_218]HAA89269.1 methionyl-tRNA formyltransferase [Peptococcaceae bacterium]
MKILFMGTSKFAIPTLLAILQSEWQLVGVITQPDRRKGRGLKVAPPPVKKFCQEHGVPVYQPESVKDAGLQPFFAELMPDVIVVVSFGQLLPSWLLELPPLGCLNLHPSLLPAYRGPAPIQRAIINGEKETGVSTMFLNEKMDAGDIILQQRVEIGSETTFGELEQVLAEKGAQLMMETLRLVEQGKAPRIPQDEVKATYAPPIQPGEREISWDHQAEALFNKIRGMNPVPGAYTFFKGKVLKIWRAQVLPGVPGEFLPGQVTETDKKQGFIVQTGEGRLLIKEVQPAGRPRMSAAEFLRGYRLQPGTVLGE